MIKPYLTTKSLIPEDQESPINFLRRWITPEEYFFRRNHLPYPQLFMEALYLPVDGQVNRSIVISFQDLLKMPSKEIVVPLECSGNKRENFAPRVYGEQWEKGAVSQGIWKGVPLAYILYLAGLKESAAEVVFEGYDIGKRKDMDQIVNFKRSLPIEKALHKDTIVAYEYNGKQIPYEHGYPLRLIVPGWYAMASVKWLKKITVIDIAFNGPFQSIDYVYYPYKSSDKGKFPVTSINLTSIIQKPQDYEVLDTGTHYIYGMAWSSGEKIIEVQVSTDGGANWHKSELEQIPKEIYSWTLWSYSWTVLEKGEYTLMSRAIASNGGTQPLEAFWNRKGYGYNAADKVHVKIE